ncbi:hypothetical protein [Asanoa iriomotensis]|uniref:Cytidylate kinase n=1 Tax=Asanoa iriomotensis TaxID=234613 RepID=A0ABQ4BTY1_9ACTN|nr:hypothetical protein [Asanoa iriomotensis]GIF53986.1 hypothetical protein Air01nite_00810 [Asanoa iriomotensis]
MRWDPVRTLREALWIGGGQWAGKSTVAGLLAGRHGLTHYHYDYHDARGHQDRRLAAMVRRGEPAVDEDWEAYWIGPTPREQADRIIAGFAERFVWVQDDLRALVTPRPVLAEGWGLRPELVLPVAGSTGQMVVLVPTEEFRQERIARTPRAGAVGHALSDPALAQRNRVERDRLVAADAVAQARWLGVRVISVDGTRDAEAMADLVADHFAAFLP